MEDSHGKESNDRKNKEGTEIQSARAQQMCRLRQTKGIYQEIPDVQGLF
jgi:hypothetical protein